MSLERCLIRAKRWKNTTTVDSSLGSDSLSGPVSLSPDANGEIMVCDLNKGNLLRLIK